MRVALLASEQWGVLSTAELRQCGLDDKAIWVRTRNGHLHRLHRGVYAVGHTNITLEGRFLAAVKACGPAATLSHFSAAALWGFHPWDDRHPEVTVPGPAGRQHRGIKAHRSKTLTRNDITRRKGIRVTTPARTLHDLSSKLPFKPLRRAARQAQSLRLVAPRDLPHTIAPAPTRSELEDVLLDLIANAGFELPDVNVPLSINGRRVIPDLRWPAQRLVVEADGAQWHDNPTAREDDAERQALLEAHGERVVRVTWDQATRKQAQTVKRLTEAGAPRLQGP